MSRRVATALFALSVLVLFGAPLALGASPPHDTRVPEFSATVGQPRCGPVEDLPPCTAPSGNPTATTTPCRGEGCLPSSAGTTEPGGGDRPQTPTTQDTGVADCDTFDIGCHISHSLNAIVRGLVTAALNPLLTFLSESLLTTPTLDDLPQTGPLWSSSWQLVLAAYTTIVVIGGLLVMTHETLQTRYAAKEILPRLVAGFLVSFLSLFVVDKLITLANGLSAALLSSGLDADSAGSALRDMVTGALSGGGLFLLLMGLALAVMLVVLLVTYVLRVAITVVLVIAAPLLLMGHALPATEDLARWWWRAITGVLAIQVAQSLVLLVALKVFFAPSGWTPFGPRPSGMVNLLVALALITILVKIPFWILKATQINRGRSFAGSLARGYLTYKTFGLLRGATAGTSAGAAVRGGSGGGAGGAGGARTPPPMPPRPTPPPPRSTGARHSPARSAQREPIEPRVVPPIEDTVWGRGRTTHDSDSAREPVRAEQHRPIEPAQRRWRADAHLPDAARRARAGAAQAWQPVTASPVWRPAAPGSSALLARPYDELQPAASSRRPAAAAATPRQRPSDAPRRRDAAAEKVAARAPQPLVSRTRPTAQHRRRGGGSS